MTEQQWNEFFDKLDFVQLAGRWELLPLHWLDDDFPEASSELARDLVSGLLEVRNLPAESVEDQVRELCQEYRNRLSSQTMSLDARLCPPGSRVTLSYLNPENLGEGDCLITVGSWDRVGYLIAELAKPGDDHLEAVGENPVRREPGALAFRHILLFPDKGTPSPRAFRSLCEKTLRQGRGLGARHFSITHLHLPQTGLADRFAAAELVSAIRQMLRDSPGTTVDILAFSHRNFSDYKHWFDSLKQLSQATSKPTGYEQVERDTAKPEDDDAHSEVADTLRNLAKRSTDFATGATASVSRWLTGGRDEPRGVHSDRPFSYEERRLLAKLYLGRPVQTPERDPDHDDLASCYLALLNETVAAELAAKEDRTVDPELLSQIRAYGERLDPNFPLTRYFQLLHWRLCRASDEPPHFPRELILAEARRWGDLPLARYLEEVQEDCQDVEANDRLIPVIPGGCRISIEA